MSSMEKRVAWSPQIECNGKISATNDCGVTDSNRDKFVSDEPPVYDQPEHCTAETPYAQGLLEGMVVQYSKADQPSSLRLNAQSLNNCSILSCKRDLSERIPDSKTLSKQVDSYKQENREHQIQQWLSKHSHKQETLSKEHWLGAYPQPKEGSNTSETSTPLQLFSAYQSLETNQFVRQPQAFVKSSSNKIIEHVESSKKHVHFLSSNALIDNSDSLHLSEGVSLKKRKLADSNPDAHQECSLNALAVECQPNGMTGSPSLAYNIHGTEVTLRQWLSRPGRTLDSLESLNIFRQIVHFVDLAHAQSVVLKNVRPSMFLLSSLHRITFLDSASSSSSSALSEPSTGAASAQASLADTATMRIGSASQITERHATEAQSRHSRDSEGHLQMSDRIIITGTEGALMFPGQVKRSNDRPCFVSDFATWETGKAHMEDKLRIAQEGPSSEFQQESIFSVRSTRLLEDIWYTSPEEVQDGTCSFASDVYSLGVLFFELFCPFTSWEEHSKIMLDLRHRILPPHLLSDRPKEAAFCLWLLHPEPNSRPKSRDVQHSDLLNDAVEALAERQDAMNIEEKELDTEVLLDFLLRMQEQKRAVATKLTEEISCLSSDIMEVKRRQSCSQLSCTTLDDPDPSSRITQERASAGAQCSSKRCTSNSGQVCENTECFNRGINSDIAVNSGEKQSTFGFETKRNVDQIRSKSARLMSNFDKFEEAYFVMRWNVQPAGVASQATQEASSGSAPTGPGFLDRRKSSKLCSGSNIIEEKDSLGCFFDSLCKYARYSRFEVKAALLHGNLSNNSNMVCSLSFDRDQEYFATAGICRRIRVFDCDAVLNENADIHYPVVEMMANSKLSSICWNSYIKSHIASSDYNGVVQLWDASTAQILMQYKEHKKRAWSVDFSQADPTKLASGSDDGSVKLWSINQEGSIGMIKTEANVCCVQFAGDSAHRIAFGSADYKVYCYDLRNLRVPWCTLVNHSKTVSYVKFLDSDRLVSASTDNTLKLWELSRTNMVGGVCKVPSLTYTGHTNEKNFIGLSVMDGYIACGSETNAVFAYHKSLPMPVATHKFGWIDPLTGKSMGDDTGKFVSSVCWRAKSQTLLAANSLGNVKILEMV